MALMLQLGFRSTPVPGIEVVGIRELRQRMTVGGNGQQHRVGFHVITVVANGTGRREVDFTDVPLDRDSVLWVRPGQVQRFEDGDLDGVHLLVAEEFVASLPAADTISVRQPVHVVDRVAADSVRALTAELARELERADPSRMVLQLLLRAVLVLLGRRADEAPDGGTGDPVAARFRTAIETSFTELHTVAEYAQILGYSIRTISRAVAQAHGTSPKHLIDRRIALEAQRLLGYTDLPVARIAHRLGFDEPTNFSRFFQRATGIRATQFRRERQSVTASNDSPKHSPSGGDGVK